MNRLKIVRGNDFSLTIPVRSIVFDKEGSKVIPTANAVPLDDCTLLKVNLVDELGAITPITSYSMPYDGTDGSLIVHISADLDCGWYGLEITYTLEGRRYRSYERKVFKIVENNGKSYVSGEQFEGEMSYQIDTMWTLYGYTSPTFVLDGEFFSRGEGEGNAIQQYGTGAQATGKDAIAIGYGTVASGTRSHAEGWGAKATGSYAHAEGGDTEASSYGSHAEGRNTKATGDVSHAEGLNTTASGEYASHAEGRSTTASGAASHAGGFRSEASGLNSFAHGSWVKTSKANAMALGRYNEDIEETEDGNFVMFSIGGGTSESNRKNIFEIWRNGDVVIPINNEKTTLQYHIQILWKLISLLKDGTSITDSALELTEDDIAEGVIPNSETIQGLEVKPYALEVPEDGWDDADTAEEEAEEDNYYGGELIGHDDNYYVNPSHPTPSGGTANLSGTIEPAPIPDGKGTFVPINGGSGGVSGNNSGGEMSTTN